MARGLGLTVRCLGLGLVVVCYNINSVSHKSLCSCSQWNGPAQSAQSAQSAHHKNYLLNVTLAFNMLQSCHSAN